VREKESEGGRDGEKWGKGGRERGIVGGKEGGIILPWLLW
jgi:hypothetical protein